MLEPWQHEGEGPFKGRWFTSQSCTPCARRKQVEWEQRQQRRVPEKYACVPERYRVAELEHFRSEIGANFEQFRNCLLHPKVGVFLWGKSGRGKTHAMAAIAKAMLDKGYKCIWAGFREFCDDIDNGRGDRMSSVMKVKQKYLEVDCLFFDDISAAKNINDKECMSNRENFCDILNRRFNDCKITFMTSNLAVENVEDVFGGAIGSRFHDYEIIEITGIDRRKQ